MVASANARQNFKPVGKLRRRRFAAALHGRVDGSIRLTDMDIIDAKTSGDIVRRDHEGAAHAARNPDPEPVADEIFSEPLDGGIGDDTAILDLRVDQIYHAKLRGLVSELGPVDADFVAGLQRTGMAFRNPEPWRSPNDTAFPWMSRVSAIQPVLSALPALVDPRSIR